MRISRTTLALLLVAAVAVGWGWTQWRSSGRLQARYEGNYQRAFNQIVWNTENIDSNFAKLMVTNDPHRQAELFSELRLQAFAARQALAQLPLYTSPLAKTETYFSVVEDVSRKYMRQAVEGGGLSTADRATLRKLRGQAKTLASEFSKALDGVMAGRMQFSPAEQATALDFDNRRARGRPPAVLGTFQRLEQALKPPLGVDGQPFKEKPLDKPKAVGTRPISRSEAIAIAERFLDRNDRRGRTRIANLINGQFRTYNMRVPLANNRTAFIDVTRTGGQVTWMLAERDVNERRYKDAQAVEAARRWLAERGYRGFEMIHVESDRNVAQISFVPLQDGVILYPDVIRVQVALDNLEIMGFLATPFLTFNTRRDLPKPILSKEEAGARLAPDLEVVGEPRLALIRAEDDDREVLTWKFDVREDGKTYQIFVNTETGDEEDIQTLNEEVS